MKNLGNRPIDWPTGDVDYLVMQGEGWCSDEYGGYNVNQSYSTGQSCRMMCSHDPTCPGYTTADIDHHNAPCIYYTDLTNQDMGTKSAAAFKINEGWLPQGNNWGTQFYKHGTCFKKDKWGIVNHRRTIAQEKEQWRDENNIPRDSIAKKNPFAKPFRDIGKTKREREEEAKHMKGGPAKGDYGYPHKIRDPESSIYKPTEKNMHPDEHLPHSVWEDLPGGIPKPLRDAHLPWAKGKPPHAPPHGKKPHPGHKK